MSVLREFYILELTVKNVELRPFFSKKVNDLIEYLSTAKPIISKACAAISKLNSLLIGSYKAQIDQARKNKTGIIMYVAPLPDGIGVSASFGAQ